MFCTNEVNVSHYLGVFGATGFRVDLKTINPVKTENRAQAHNMRQNLSLRLKYRGINHMPTRVTAFKTKIKIIIC